MPRYFFDAEDGVEIHDAVGRDLPDAVSARREAVRVASGYAADPDWLQAEGAVVVQVRDEAGAAVATVRLACLVEAA